MKKIFTSTLLCALVFNISLAQHNDRTTKGRNKALALAETEVISEIEKTYCGCPDLSAEELQEGWIKDQFSYCRRNRDGSCGGLCWYKKLGIDEDHCGPLGTGTYCGCHLRFIFYMSGGEWYRQSEGTLMEDMTETECEKAHDAFSRLSPNTPGVPEGALAMRTVATKWRNNSVNVLDTKIEFCEKKTIGIPAIAKHDNTDLSLIPILPMGFPNPVNIGETFTIEAGVANSYVIQNSLGQIISKGDIEHGKAEILINEEHFTPGMNFVSLYNKDDGSQSTFKLIVE